MGSWSMSRKTKKRAARGRRVRVRARVQIGVRFPVGLRKRIEHAADQEDATMSAIVVRAVEQYFEQREVES